MTNTQISNNNPEKELTINKSNSDDKTKQIINKNTTQNKKISSKSDKSNKSFNEISDKIFSDLVSKKDSLVKEIKELETKKIELEKDIESNFQGQSDNIAKRVKGFQEYLTGALQNLSQNVEKLELVSQPIIVKPSPLDEKKQTKNTNNVVNVPALSETFKPDEEIIKSCFSTFNEQPDFYAEPWKLRRSLDSSDIEIMDDWFFNMGGRGSLESRGSRQKNALLSAGLISILGELYGDQFQTLILASQPERLGEWRRILQDSLGLTRDDFGPNSGIVLFERPEGVIERADRLEANEELPFIIIDAAETSVEIPILQFPLWVAFAGSDNEIYDDLELN
ncbi:DUF3086 domain-containing protein [Prochlorococcus marinus str. MU1402]|uniref:DUF3086 domain-containing protein n=1 Tax=Prochlorococcus marinus TaxID=1219 RepID=UPI001ADA7B7F|nr:DUF3086 domain-containing protein [Prochlorococcus marinus]MBO8232492.1 DUF3086 domain-containing protein [Prochlorococcus marinus XMU1402]MBW3057219.1 DUF3086 domain-containing protein [Prochlorococcus marinus str. MU1402]